MIKEILNYFGYALAELLPIGGKVHFEFLNHYFKYPLLGADPLLIIYSALLVGLFIYFIRDIFRILIEIFKALRLLLIGRATIRSVCTEFKMLNLFLVTIVATAVYYPIARISYEYSYSLYLSCGLMIVSAVLLRLSEVFTIIKVDGMVFNKKETLLFTVAQALSVIPGFSRIASMMALGKFLGSEKKHLAGLVLLSFIPLVIIQLSFMNSDVNYIFNILYVNWKVFLIVAGLIVLSLDFILMLLASPSFYKFYYYLAGIAVWTILDMFFSKRGL